MPSATIITSQAFETLIDNLGIDFSGVHKIAVAVSGGGDSLALSVLLAGWCKARDIVLHALTVDHGLRSESADEAKVVAGTLQPLGIKHKILLWSGEKPKSRIQEAARDARYKLMGEYCDREAIKYLFLAHHAGDQIETILFRIAKGTGFDGLTGMLPVQIILENGLSLVRPLLSVSHADLLLTLRDRNLNWIEDPSNHNHKYARSRIRSIIDVLEKEGLTAHRISVFTKRIKNNVDIASYLIEEKYKFLILYKDTKRIDININDFLSLPHEGKVRIIKNIISDLHPYKKYPARLEDIERMGRRMDHNFRGATLGGCIFRKKKNILSVTIEDGILPS